MLIAFVVQNYLIQRGCRVKRSERIRATLVGLTILCGWSTSPSAAPQQLDCVLTDTEYKIGSENKGVIINFDEEKRVLMARQNDNNYTFGSASISNVSISGRADNISVGIDRSSLGIVWQEYATDNVRTEYGHCRPTAPPN